MTASAKEKLAALYAHWCTADSINYHLRRSLESPANHDAELAEPFKSLGIQQSAFMTLSVWYALLYVVIEGYRELEIKDPEIDDLLSQTEFVDALRRFRNATFHYQEDLLSDKLLKFISLAQSEKWVGRVNAALDRFLIDQLGIKEMAKEWKMKSDKL
jgi:hypothetical protein